MDSIRTTLRYIKPEWKHRADAPGIGDRESRHANTALFEVDIHDARDEGSHSLDTSGFELVEGPPNAAGADRSRIKREHEPLMLELVKNHTAAAQTHLFHFIVRTEDQSDFNTAYSRFVHCDFNLRAMPAMTADLLARRGVEPDPDWSYAWINTWQPFDHPVEQNPLATLDATSLGSDDLIDYRYTGYEGLDGLVAAPVYNPDHRWFTYSSMQPDEVLLTKQLESRPGRARQCPHSAYRLPDTPPDAAPRRSVEMRILAVFEPD